MMNFIKNKEGVGLAELIISIGLAGTIVLISSKYSLDAAKKLKFLDFKSDQVIDESMFRRRIMSDLLLSSPSYNFLIQQSADSTSCPDGPPPNFWDITPKAYCSELSVKLTQAGDSFKILIKNDSDYLESSMLKRNRTELISPIKFFEGTSSYLTIKLSQTKLKSELSKFSKLSKDSTYLFKGIVPVGSEVKYNEYATIVGTLSGKLDITDSNLFYPIPSDACSESADDDFETFLRCIPASGGLPHIFIIPVSLLNYTVESNSGERKQGLKLYREVLDIQNPSKVIKRNLIASNIKEVYFSRESSTGRVVNFDIIFNKYDKKK